MYLNCKASMEVSGLVQGLEAEQIMYVQLFCFPSTRKFDGGLLLTSTGQLLPLLDLDCENGPEFTAGDVRAIENPGLTSMHTVFVREHNRIALGLQYLGVSTDDEELYQMARR